MRANSIQIEKSSPIPLYYQLAESIKEQIGSGHLRPGEQLPAERDLAEQVGISRMTARQAIAYLVREGTLEVRHGAGTFVASPKLTYDALHLLGFTAEMMRQGGVVGSRVLEQTVVTPPPRVAAELNLAPDDQAAKIVRLRFSNETPLLLETSFIPIALYPGSSTRTWRPNRCMRSWNNGPRCVLNAPGRRSRRRSQTTMKAVCSTSSSAHQ